MRVFRIEKRKYLDQTLSGLGAAMAERNRWNSRNTPLVYSAQARSLALIELLVHLDLRNGPPKELYYVEIDIPDELRIAQVEASALPQNWTCHPPGFRTQKRGDQFAKEQQAPVLRVPSSLVPREFNYLINPIHKDMANISVVSAEPLTLDGRLTGGLNG